MKSLYNEDHRYTKDAGTIDNDTFQAIRPIFMEWAKDYSPREISHIMQAAITDVEHEVVLGWHKNEIQPEK